MAPLTEAAVRDHPAPTPYAVSSLKKLSGGTASFLYRGTLFQPSASDAGTAPVLAKTVVLKRSIAFAAANRNFALDVKRRDYEETMMYAQDSFLQSITTTIRGSCTAVEVRVPYLYHFDR
ncbi:phosphotransferase enzyme family protein [Apiospora rasikravindrae]|uniref:Phosphotransferase enzyme family protein n=1 Tax=Apiospora rasikravindrae TaxID=990691 RepID=A0ABR1T625_9PEZI